MHSRRPLGCLLCPPRRLHGDCPSLCVCTANMSTSSARVAGVRVCTVSVCSSSPTIHIYRRARVWIRLSIYLSVQPCAWFLSLKRWRQPVLGRRHPVHCSLQPTTLLEDTDRHTHPRAHAASTLRDPSFFLACTHSLSVMRMKSRALPGNRLCVSDSTISNKTDVVRKCCTCSSSYVFTRDNKYVTKSLCFFPMSAGSVCECVYGAALISTETVRPNVKKKRPKVWQHPGFLSACCLADSFLFRTHVVV